MRRRKGPKSPQEETAYLRIAREQRNRYERAWHIQKGGRSCKKVKSFGRPDPAPWMAHEMIACAKMNERCIPDREPLRVLSAR